jgi:MFS family permease
VILDVTVVNIALPSIGADLRLNRAWLTWVVTAYTLCFGGLLLLGGRLADTLGRRRTFLTGLGLFTYQRRRVRPLTNHPHLTTASFTPWT